MAYAKESSTPDSPNFPGEHVHLDTAKMRGLVNKRDPNFVPSMWNLREDPDETEIILGENYTTGATFRGTRLQFNNMMHGIAEE